MRVVSSYAVLFALAGCSVINSFDDVKPAVSAAGGSSGMGGDETGGKSAGGSSGGSNAGAGGSKPDASAGGSGGAHSGGAAGGGAAGTGGTGGKAGSGGGGAGAGGGGNDAAPDVFIPGGPTGALVAYNTNDKKLYVLNPANGKALSSEPMNRVRAVINDGAADPSDHWLIFEDVAAAQPLQDPLTLHIRDLNTTTGEWKEIGSLDSVPPPFYSRPAVFGQGGKAFIAYLNDPTTPASGGSVANLVVLDVTDPTKPALVPIPAGINPLPAGDKQGLVADQSSVNVFIRQPPPCANNDAGIAACTVNVVRFLVNTGVTKVSTKPVGEIATSGNVDLVDDPFHNYNIVGFPPLQEPTPNGVCTQTSRTQGVVRRLSPIDQSSTLDVTIQMEMTRFAGGATFDVCDNIAFFTTAISDVAIWAISLNGAGTTTKQCNSSGGGRLLYEPYTHTLFRPAGTDMQAFTVDGKASPPTLTEEVISFPAGFQFGAAGVRSPSRPSCQ